MVNVVDLLSSTLRYACTVSSGVFVFGVMWFLIKDMDKNGIIGPEDHEEFKVYNSIHFLLILGASQDIHLSEIHACIPIILYEKPS